MFQKPKRHVNPANIELVKKMPCTINDEECYGPVQAHHVTTRGARGGDEKENLMPLCQRHHADWHFKGPGWMIKTHTSVVEWLEFYERTDVLERIKR